MDDEVVTVRLPRKDAESVDRLVREGAFINRSDFVRNAVRTALEGGDDGAIARLGMGVDQPRAQARRSPRGVKR